MVMKDEIKHIQERINELSKPKASLKQSAYARSGLGVRVLVELFSGICVGAGIGYFLDDIFNSRPWLLILFLFFGAGAGILNVYRLAKIEGQKRG